MQSRARIYTSAVGGLALCAGVAVARTAAGPSPYQRDIDAAMVTMHAGMMAPPTGDIDRDFVATMVPHHQGAIDMAVAELRYGRDAHLKRIAQEIIIEQQQEIAAMRLALGQPLPASAAAPTRLPLQHDMPAGAEK